MSDLCRCTPPDRADCPIHGPVPRPDTNRFETPPDTVFVAWTGTKGFYADPDGSFVRRSEYLRLHNDRVLAERTLTEMRTQLQGLHDLLRGEVASPPPRTLSADEFEHLALLGHTPDQSLILGPGAAERVLTHGRRLTETEVEAFLTETAPLLDPARTARIRARFYELLHEEMGRRSQGLYERMQQQVRRATDDDFPVGGQRLVGPDE